MKYKKVLVLGGTGFLGKNLQKVKPEWTYWGSSDANLMNPFALRTQILKHRFDAIIYLASMVGGIKKNMYNNSKMLTTNTIMAINVFKVAQECMIKRILVASSTCAFPDFQLNVEAYPLEAEDFWDGKPYFGNFGYGESKRFLQSLCVTYSKDYGMVCSSFALSNIYGPHDNFDNEDSHFVPAIISRVNKLKDGDTLEIWGDGSAMRQQLYVEDAAAAIPIILEKYEEPDLPLPVTADENLSIKKMVNIIVSKSGKKLKTKYSNDLIGQYRKDVQNDLFKKLISNFYFTNFKKGVKLTINWYEKSLKVD